MKVEINGKVVQCCTIGTLAALCNRTPGLLRKWEQNGTMPTANFSIPWRRTQIHGDMRVYTMELAQKLGKYVRENIRQGTPISTENKIEIQRMFDEEKEKYSA